jgi:hypothetical protein
MTADKSPVSDTWWNEFEAHEARVNDFGVRLEAYGFRLSDFGSQLADFGSRLEAHHTWCKAHGIDPVASHNPLTDV